MLQEESFSNMISTEFLRDEVRCGFYIPTAIKQAWAGSLSVLSVVDRICEKHGIRYFAEWGTLLGTVRHGGFVPWDDDLDIGMLREDYEKFRKVAPDEFPEGFCFQDFRNQEDHWLFVTRVVNCNHICFEEEHLNRFNNFPYIASIDIFISDYIYRDEKKENERDELVKQLLAIADGVVESRLFWDQAYGAFCDADLKYDMNKDFALECASIRDMFETLPGDVSAGSADPESRRRVGIALYELAEKQMAKARPEDSDRIGQIFPWVLKGGRGLPKEYYHSMLRLPFEETTIPVPCAYGKVLQSRYGDYYRIRKIWGGHGYPFFEGQKRALEEVLGSEIPEYEFDRSMISVNGMTYPYNDFTDSDSSENMACKMSISGRSFSDQGLSDTESSDMTCSDGDFDSLDFSGMKTQNDHASDANNEGSIGNKFLVSDGIIDSIIGSLDHKPCRILFLAAGASLWKDLKWIYDGLCDRGFGGCITVVALPVVKKDALGRITADSDAIDASAHVEAYPKDIRVTEWWDYDVRSQRPDLVFIQDPYDGENPVLTVPKEYYTAHIKKHAGRIVFVQPFLNEQDDFSKEALNDVYNLKHYIQKPGIVYSDMVIVRSREMKERFLEKLVLWAGTDTCYYWDNKIVPLTESRNCAKQDENATQKRELHISDKSAGCAGVDSDAVITGSSGSAGRGDAVITGSSGSAGRGDAEINIREYGGEKGGIRETDTTKEQGLISGKDSIIKDKPVEKLKKRLLYVIGLNELYEYGDDVYSAIRERLSVMERAKDSIEVTISFYPAGAEKLFMDIAADNSEADNVELSSAKVNSSEADDAEAYNEESKNTEINNADINDQAITNKEIKVFQSVKMTGRDDRGKVDLCRIDVSGICPVENIRSDDFDAYYGSPSPYVVQFTRAGKPVMIASYGV